MQEIKDCHVSSQPSNDECTFALQNGNHYRQCRLPVMMNSTLCDIHQRQAGTGPICKSTLTIPSNGDIRIDMKNLVSIINSHFNAVESEFTNLHRANEQLKVQLNSAEDQIERFNKELANAPTVATIQNIESEFRKVLAQKNELENLANTLQQRVADAVRRERVSETDRGELVEQLKSARARIEELKTKLNDVYVKYNDMQLEYGTLQEHTRSIENIMREPARLRKRVKRQQQGDMMELPDIDEQMIDDGRITNGQLRITNGEYKNG